MLKIAEKICKYKKIIFIIAMLLLIPSFIGMQTTRVNYDILAYLPDNVDTVQGENILTNEFNMRVRFLPGINRYWTSLSGINRYWTSLVTRGLNSNLKTALKSWGFVKYNQLITEFTQKYKLDVDIETLKKFTDLIFNDALEAAIYLQKRKK